MRPVHIIAAALFLPLVATCALAQGVGINGTGAPADTSAILDLSSSAKGFLAPRMTALQRAAIVLPATGLLVYQTDGTVGLYFNAGTPGAPSWQLVGSGATAGQWSVSGADLYYSAGKVGIGTAPVNNYGLTIIDPSNGLRVQTNTTGGVVASFGGVGQFLVDAPGVIGGRFTILENGNVGIGNSTPTNKLTFAPAIGKKISLFPDSPTNDYGFGVASGRLQIYSGNGTADVALGWDNAGIFMERFAVKPNGALALSGSTGGAGQVLTSNGSGAAASWVTPGVSTWALNGSNLWYAGGNVGIGTSTPNAPLGFPPALGKKITLYPGATGDVGLGVAGNRLYLYSDNPNADVALGYDAAGTFNERFAFKPNGAMAVMGNAGAAGQVLQSNGGGGAVTWGSSTNTLYNNVNTVSTTAIAFDLVTGTDTALPGVSLALGTSGNAKADVSFDIQVYNFSCAFCGASTFELHVWLDGTIVKVQRHLLQNGTTETYSGNYFFGLAPGAHTVSMSAVLVAGPSISVGGGTASVGSTLNVQLIPQ